MLHLLYEFREPNNGMHPTRNRASFILNLAGGRVMPGVRCSLGFRDGIMRRQVIAIMSAQELEELSTRQLLARLERLHRCEASASLSDVGEQPGSPGVLFKDTAEWAAAFEQVKGALARREHVPGGVELVEQRKRRAKLARTTERRAGRQRRR